MTGPGTEAARPNKPGPTLSTRARPSRAKGSERRSAGPPRRTVTAPTKREESRTNVLTASGGGYDNTALRAPDTAGSSNSGDRSRDSSTREIHAGAPLG